MIIARGYKRNKLLPFFQKAHQLALQNDTHLPPEPEPDPSDTDEQTLYLHLKYTPGDPPSQDLQKAWRYHLSRPHASKPLHELANNDGYKCSITKLLLYTIAK